MNEDQFNRISEAIADPRRMEILERLAREDEVACSTLVSDFPVTQATMSHHLKELTNAGLVKIRREAKFSFYGPERKVGGNTSLRCDAGSLRAAAKPESPFQSAQCLE